MKLKTHEKVNPMYHVKCKVLVVTKLKTTEILFQGPFMKIASLKDYRQSGSCAI